MSRLPRVLVRCLLSLAAGAILAGCNAGEANPAVATQSRLPEPPKMSLRPGADAGNQTAVLAGGCFWGVEAVFEHVKGVIDVASGYAGGDAASASYPAVSSGITRHAESVRVVYDPAVVSYGELLRIFFDVAHDPTQLNRQGPDRGPQYRSAIFASDPEQARVARNYITALGEANAFPRPIVTEVNALEAFHPAEEYHQDYARRNPHEPYIVFHDAPKVKALAQRFPDRYRP